MSCITEESIDDLLHEVFLVMLDSGRPIEPSRGKALELSAMRLELTDPRARVSRTHARGRVFSCLGELVWYLSGSSDSEQIEFYLPKYKADAESDGSVHAAYGSRLFDGENRLHRAITTLLTKQDSRQAVVPLLDGADLVGDYRHVPCTSVLQFLLRGNVVDMVVYMRSNDAYLGLPHDIFAFTMLQELVARTVDAELGKYVHMVGSLHLYDRDRAGADRFLNEGFSSLRPMPPMPERDPWDDVNWLVQTEAALRAGEIQAVTSARDTYWADLARLINAFVAWKTSRDAKRIDLIRRSMASDIFDVFFKDRFDVLEG